jgi:glycosyltransferase involved in cell wall biosynthesis
MLVANDVSIDVRVRKMAASVAKNHDVTVLGLASGTSRSTFEMDGFRVVLLPVTKPKTFIQRVRISAGKRILRMPAGVVVRGIIKGISTKSMQTLPSSRAEISKPDERKEWRVVLPETKGYENIFGAEIEKLSPDLVHSQDIHLLNVAAKFKASRKLHGENCALIYDAHEYIRGLGSIDLRRRDAYAEMESEFIGEADAVITVSNSIAERIMKDHNLSTKPFLVLNAPSQAKIQITENSPSVRKVCGLDDAVPLIIYSGGIHISRGMDLLVASLEFLPGVHLAMTSNRESWYIEELKEKAGKFRAADRLHFVPYVLPEEVVPYISTATIGISPLPADVVNYDLALPNKLFDYMQAKLPIVSSNCREVSDLLSKIPLGETFDWQDPKALATTVNSVISRSSEYDQTYVKLSELLKQFTWEAQELELNLAYASCAL